MSIKSIPLVLLTALALSTAVDGANMGTGSSIASGPAPALF
jgi:hypothetical protein